MTEPDKQKDLNRCPSTSQRAARAAGYGQTRDDSINPATISLSGIWLLKMNGRVLVLVKRDGGWFKVISEFESDEFSHAVHPGGIAECLSSPACQFGAAMETKP